MLPAQSRKATDDAWLTATRDRHTETAAAYGIIVVRDAADNQERLQGGRLLERIHLRATGNGIALQHMNQLTERADRERELGITPHFGDALQQLLPDGWQALSLFRVGYARAAGEVTLSRRRHQETVKISEVGPQESAPILRKYLRQVKVVRPFFDVTEDSPLDAFAAEADRHPVFRTEAI